jgi:hypothetical protein
MKLNDQQVREIEVLLQKGGISNESLAADLLDHLCCVMEIQLKRGKDFDEALEEAVAELAPDGLKQIDLQTRYLLNSKHILNMKKLIYSVGFLGAASLAMGLLFKIMYWPMANILSMSGVVALFLIFVPLVALDRYKYEVSKALSSRFKFFAGIASSVLVGLSILFKTFHLMGAGVMLVTGVTIFVFGYLPFLFFSLYKKSTT